MKAAKYDALRGVAAMWVLLAHVDLVYFDSGFGMAGEVGRWAVLVFFLLSGFLVTGSIRDNCRRHGGEFMAESYVRARCKRIFPPLIGSMVLIAALGLFVRGGGNFLYHERDFWNALTMQRGLIMVNGPLWSLYIEVQAYAVAGGLAAAVCSRSMATRVCGAAIAAAAVAGLEGLGPFYVLVWGVGAWFAMRSPRWLDVLILIAILVCAQAVLADSIAGAAVRPLEVAIFTFVGWVLFSVLPATAPRILVWSGGWSYSLYITHYPIMLAIGFTPLPAWVKAAGALALSIAFAVPFAAVFERGASQRSTH